MDLTLGFGVGRLPVRIPDRNVLAVLLPNEVPAALAGGDEVRRALSAPIGAPRLRELIHPGETVAIVTSDVTRPCPTALLLPPLLEELEAADVRRADVTLVFALGSHRFQTEAEQRKLAGSAYDTIRCIDGDPGDCVRLGFTSRGTPVDVTRSVAEADRRICLGNIEYHYFAGYSGGAKAIMPGVSTREAIRNNHALMVHPRACAGNLASNPLRADLEEAAALCGVDYIVNVVLDEHQRVVRAVAGGVIEAHRAGCRFLDAMYEKQIPERADIVLVSQGGAPKDLNLYQTQKALDNARHAVRSGGVIILVGACREGLGEATFERWMLEARQPADLVKRIAADFQLGGHKAAAIAMVLEYADVFLVSELDPSLVQRLFLKPFSTAQAALNAAFRQLGPDARVIVMPYGGSTLPRVAEAQRNAANI